MTDTTVSSIFNDRAGGLRAKVTGIYGLLVAGNVAAWLRDRCALHRKLPHLLPDLPRRGLRQARRAKLSPVLQRPWRAR